MVFADEIRKTILRLADERGRGKTFGPHEVAQAVDKQNWQRVVDQVILVGASLVQEGKIVSNQTGKTVDVITYSKGPA